MVEMQNKKGQAEVITTVLIILLVLAAVVIVWQVVNSIIKNAANEVESQSECIGFLVTIGPLKSGGQISGYPNKAVQSMTFHINGKNIFQASGALTAGQSYTTSSINPLLVTGDIITAVGTIKNQLCDGKVNQKVVA